MHSAACLATLARRLQQAHASRSVRLVVKSCGEPLEPEDALKELQQAPHVKSEVLHSNFLFLQSAGLSAREAATVIVKQTHLHSQPLGGDMQVELSAGARQGHSHAAGAAAQGSQRNC
ncbi:hypothetical protein N2152v2_008732 [Parachlorella kessleri]